MKLLNSVCPLLATHWFMQAYKLLSIRSLYVVWPQVSKTNKYMPNLKQMSCFKGKSFCENLELNIFYKDWNRYIVSRWAFLQNPNILTSEYADVPYSIPTRPNTVGFSTEIQNT